GSWLRSLQRLKFTLAPFMIIPEIVFPLAYSANTLCPTINDPEDSIFLIEDMAALALFLCEVKRSRSVASQYICSGRDHFQVHRVDALLVPAQVIKLFTLR